MTGLQAFLPDIHGNSPALGAVLADMRPFDCENIFVLGDIINGLDPAGCLEMLFGSPKIRALKGNAEHYLMTPDLDEFPGPREPFLRYPISLIGWLDSQLTDAQKKWLDSRPDLIELGDWLLVHDSPEGRMYPESRYQDEIDQKFQELYYHDPGFSPSSDAADFV